MTKRKKGQTPYESEHPNRFWMPDVPGHRKKSPRINNEQSEELKRQIERLKEEIILPETPGGEKIG